MNFDNTIGAVGFLPRLLPASVYPIALIKYDESTGEPIRDENGLCIRCKAGEKNEMKCYSAPNTYRYLFIFLKFCSSNFLYF